MRTSGRLLLLLALAWLALWSAPACSASQENLAVRPAPSYPVGTQAPVHELRAGLSPAWTHREACEEVTEPLSGSTRQEPAKGWNAVPPAGRHATLARAGTAPPHASDILLLIQRQNE